MISFSVGAALVMAALNLFSFICLFYRIEFFKKWRVLIAILLIIMTALEAYYFLSFRRSGAEVWALQLSASLVGVTFLLFFFSLVYFVLRIPLYVVPFSQNRRKALKFALDITILIAAVSTIISGFVGGFSKPLKRRVEILIDGLKEPLSITQITDVHIGKVLGAEFMQEIVDKANELASDIVVITGDLVDLPPKLAAEKLAPLRELKSRFGVYFVLGNHEYFQGAVGECVKLIESLGVRVLANENVIVGGINLCGINDLRGKNYATFKPNLSKALSNRSADLPTVLLSHQPKIIHEISPSQNVDLLISGHTHGGQIFPFGLFVLIDQPYLYGLYRHDEKTQVFVSSGAGYWGPPLRILAPSEVVRLDLKSK